jgi:RimJ/RimL family protein N-acetyltransferase
LTAHWKPGARVRLETERFRLDTLTPLQACLATYPWTADPDLMHPFGLDAGTWSRRSWHRYFRGLDNKRKFCFGIRPKGQDRIIGLERCDLRPRGAAFLSVLIGDRAWWGKEVVRECRSAVIDFLFESVGCVRVWGSPQVRNLPSVFNYQKLGFKCEGVLRRHSYDPDTKQLEDCFIFGMLREEWCARRNREGRP